MNHLITILLFTLVMPNTIATNISNQKDTSNSQETELTIIESLNDGDSYSIEITSVGCFGGSRQTVLVSNAEGILTASFQDTVITLTDSDIEAFKTFENQLKSLSMGGCTIVDTYVVRYGSQVFTTSDGTCSWNGGKKLLKAIS